ncbi:MAG: hypothetical protein CM1200mP30_28020 [Pseudomonadota bacterium]|nr:MAG: hypothetical protein CM1200mP30_28020 [Pseudomonadota bacterium]
MWNVLADDFPLQADLQRVFAPGKIISFGKQMSYKTCLRPSGTVTKPKNTPPEDPNPSQNGYTLFYDCHGK